MQRAMSRTVGVIAVLAGLGLACSLASALPSIPGLASETPDVPEPTAVPPTEAPSTVLEDDFSNSNSGWGTGTDSDSAIEYEDGSLLMETFVGSLIVWSNPDEKDYNNVHVEITVHNEAIDDAVSFGVICHEQPGDARFHYLAIGPDGYYVIGRSEGDEDVLLTNEGEWVQSGMIELSADTYRVGADCGEDRLALYVNGKEIDSAEDTAFGDGGVGLFLWSADGPSGVIRFDDFVMTSLE